MEAVWRQLLLVYSTVNLRGNIKKCPLPQQTCSLDFTAGTAQPSSDSVLSWKANISHVPQRINPVSKRLCAIGAATAGDDGVVSSQLFIVL